MWSSFNVEKNTVGASKQCVDCQQDCRLFVQLLIILLHFLPVITCGWCLLHFSLNMNTQLPLGCRHVCLLGDATLNEKKYCGSKKTVCVLTYFIFFLPGKGLEVLRWWPWPFTCYQWSVYHFKWREECVLGGRGCIQINWMWRRLQQFAFHSLFPQSVFFRWCSPRWNVPWTQELIWIWSELRARGSVAKSRYGFGVNTSGHWRICVLFQTAEHDHQIPANTRAGAQECLEMEEYQHFFSPQCADRSMGCFMVRKDAVIRFGAGIYFHIYSSCGFSLSRRAVCTVNLRCWRTWSPLTPCSPTAL